MTLQSYITFCLLGLITVAGLFLVFGCMAINHVAGRDDDDDDTP